MFADPGRHYSLPPGVLWMCYLSVTIPVLEKGVRVCVFALVCMGTHYGNISSQPLDHLAFSLLLTVMSRGEDTQRLTWFLIDQWPFVWFQDSRGARNLKWHLPEAALER